MPSTMGLPLRATTSSFGCLVSSTTRPYVPSTWRSVRRTASSRLTPAAASAAIMWASASVSVSLTSLTPRADSASLSCSAFSMMPLCTIGDAPLGVGVRMGVHLVRLTVGGPPGVADADGGPGPVADPVPEVLDPAGRLGDLEPVPVDDGQAGRVVAAVLQAPQPLEQHRDRVPAADVPHDSAHFELTSPDWASGRRCAGAGAPTGRAPRTCAARARPRSAARSRRSCAGVAWSSAWRLRTKSSTVSLKYVATSAMTRTAVGCGRPVEAAR